MEEVTIIDQVLSTGNVNDQGYEVIPEGIEWERFTSNPVMFYNHDTNIPIGTVSNIYLKAGKWYGTLNFDGVTELSRTVRDMYRAGTLRAVSISGVPFYVEQDGVKYTYKFIVYEVSVVPLPSDKDAVSRIEGAPPVLAAEFLSKGGERVEFSADNTILTNYLKRMKPTEQKSSASAKEGIWQNEGTFKKFMSEFEKLFRGIFARAEYATESEQTERDREDERRGEERYEERKEEREERDREDERRGEERYEERKEEREERDREDERRGEERYEERKEEREERDREDERRGEERYEERKEERDRASFSTKKGRFIDAAKINEEITKQKTNFASTMERKTIHEYLRDPQGRDKFSELTRFSAEAKSMSEQQIKNDSRIDLVREFVHFASKDRGFLAAMGDMTYDMNGKASGTLRDSISRLTSFASGLNSINFVDNTPDLAKIEWSSLIYRELFPDDSWADRAARVSAEDVAGVIWVNSAVKPKIFFGNRAPLNIQASTYDDEPVGIAMKVFALDNIVWQQANTDLLAYNDVALGTSESLRWLSSKAHNYYLQQFAEAAGVSVGTSGTNTFNATGAFPANPTATGTLKQIVPGDITRLQTEFINQNFIMETFGAEMVMPAAFYAQLQSDPTLASLLTKNAGTLRPNFGEFNGFSFRPRSVTTLRDNATNAVIDPELYLDGKIANDGSVAAYTPPVIPTTAYGIALGFIPSEVIIGIGRIHVHMVEDPSNYGWRMSIDMRTGAGVARKGGKGVGIIYPTVQAAGA